jgi:hypothetical protein
MLEDAFMNAKRKNMRRGMWVACATAIGIGWFVSPDTASAGHVDVRLGRPRPAVWVPPVYETRQRVVTVPAVFEERPRKVWREPVYETRRVLVDIPAKVVTRRVAIRGPFGLVITHRVVRHVVEPARQVWKTERVLVRAGFYDTAYERVCVQPERTRVVSERVLVRRGHWSQPRIARTRHVHRHHGALHRGPVPRHRDARFRLAVHVND